MNEIEQKQEKISGWLLGIYAIMALLTLVALVLYVNNYRPEQKDPIQQELHQKIQSSTKSVSARAGEIMDLPLHDAILDFIKAADKPSISQEKPDSADAIFKLSLCSDRVVTFFVAYKVRHTGQTVDEVRSVIKDAYQVAVDKLLWMTTDRATHRNFMEDYLRIEEASIKMEFNLRLPLPPEAKLLLMRRSK